MNFLANENFPFPSIQLLRKFGYHVISISEDYPGISDTEVIEKALSDDLIILTFDKDYGEIIFKDAKENPPSVVFFRFKGKDPSTAGQMLIHLLEDDSFRIENKFSVIEEDNVRQRTYHT